MPVLSIKVDVDTDRGTRIGVPNLLKLFEELELEATFLFSLGPDNTGRAIRRIFRPGFFKKVSRTSIISTYGIRTLLNGVLLPGPHIAKRHGDVMRKTRDNGHEVGIHSYDHTRWQDGVTKHPQHKIAKDFDKALHWFKHVFGSDAKAAGAPGWQANTKTLAVYDNANLIYGSDTRGTDIFMPKIGDTVFKTMQIPTTLPTLDELIGQPGVTMDSLIDYYLSLLVDDRPNIFTVHAEIEGMKHYTWFRQILSTAKQKGIQFQKMETLAKTALQARDEIPICELIQSTVEGRSGNLAMQGMISRSVSSKA